MLSFPDGDLGGVNQHRVAVDLSPKPLKGLRIVVAADPGSDLVAPRINATDQIVPDNVAVRHERAPVKTRLIHDREVVEAHD
jgi:hypothetical protein